MTDSMYNDCVTLPGVWPARHLPDTATLLPKLPRPQPSRCTSACNSVQWRLCNSVPADPAPLCINSSAAAATHDQSPRCLMYNESQLISSSASASNQTSHQQIIKAGHQTVRTYANSLQRVSPRMPSSRMSREVQSDNGKCAQKQREKQNTQKSTSHTLALRLPKMESVRKGTLSSNTLFIGQSAAKYGRSRAKDDTSHTLLQ